MNGCNPYDGKIKKAAKADQGQEKRLAKQQFIRNYMGRIITCTRRVFPTQQSIRSGGIHALERMKFGVKAHDTWLSPDDTVRFEQGVVKVISGSDYDDAKRFRRYATPPSDLDWKSAILTLAQGQAMEKRGWLTPLQLHSIFPKPPDQE